MVFHRAAGLAGQQDAGPEIDSDEGIELLFVGELRSLSGQDVDAGVVDPDIEAAERLEGLLEEGGGGLAGSQVSLDEFAASSPGGDLLSEFLAARDRAIGMDENLGAGRGQLQGDCPADTRG